MRIASKILIILKIIAFVISGLIYTVIYASTDLLWLAILMDIIYIILIIISACALAELNKDYRKPGIAISILTLLCSSLIAGILMLCIPEEYTYTPSQRQVSKCPRCGKYGNDIQLCDIKLSFGYTKLHLCSECISKDSRVLSNKE